MDEVIDGRTANVHADLAGFNRFELFLHTCHSIENLHNFSFASGGQTVSDLILSV